MELKKTLIFTIFLIVIGISVWELYWRFQGYYPSLDRSEALWAVQRAKVNQLTGKDVVLTGSSRVHFDIQLDEWYKITGTRPIQLAIPGSTPLPVFHDIVNNTNFKGTLVVGVTLGLFFSTTNPEDDPWDASQSRIDYFYNRTYAQRLNHKLSLPLQQNLAFINEDKRVDGINLKALLNKINVGDRVIDSMPPFHNFSNISIDRNVRMIERTVTDTVFANTVKKVWKFFDREDPSLEKEATIAFFTKDATKFKERGGNLILVRCPSTGYYKDREAKFFTRHKFWDELVKRTKAKSYHYNDYETLRYFDCPEWSHLSAAEAQIFTTELAKIIINDNALTNIKTN